MDVRARQSTAPDTTIHTSRRTRRRRTNAIFTFSRGRARDRVRVPARRRAVRELRVAVPAHRTCCRGEHTFRVSARPTSTATSSRRPRRYTWRCIAPPLEPTIDARRRPSRARATPHVHLLLDRADATFECRLTPARSTQRVRAVLLAARRTPTCSTASTSSRCARSTSTASRARSRASSASRSRSRPTRRSSRPAGTTASTCERVRLHVQRAGRDVRVLARRRGFVECLSPAMFPDTDGLAAAAASARTPSRCRRSTPWATSTRRPATRTWTSSDRRRRRRRSSPARRPDHEHDASFTFSSNESTRPSSARSTAAAFAACPRRRSSTAWRRRPRAARRRDDLDGNVDPTPAIHTWTIMPPDTPAPRRRSAPRPADPTNTTDATFTFSSRRGRRRASCSLDGAAYDAVLLAEVTPASPPASTRSRSPRPTRPATPTRRPRLDVDDRQGGARHGDHRPAVRRARRLRQLRLAAPTT